MADFTKLNGYTVKDPNAIHTYDTVDDLKADSKLKAGDHAQTKAYATAGDGGHGVYIIVNDNTLIDDGGVIHELENGLKAVLQHNGVINVKQYGATGDGETDDTLAVTHAFASAKENECNIYFPNGTYILTNAITIDFAVTISGESDTKTIIKQGDPAESLINNIFSYTKIEDLCFKGLENSTAPLIKIVAQNGHTFDNLINNCQIMGENKTGIGIEFNTPSSYGIMDNTIRDTVFRQLAKGIVFNIGSGWINGNKFDNLWFYTTVRGIEWLDTESFKPCSSNVFSTIKGQYSSGCEALVYNVNGANNTFDGLHFWDGGITIQIGYHARYTKVINMTNFEIAKFIDYGFFTYVDNFITDNSRPYWTVYNDNFMMSRADWTDYKDSTTSPTLDVMQNNNAVKIVTDDTANKYNGIEGNGYTLLGTSKQVINFSFVLPDITDIKLYLGLETSAKNQRQGNFLTYDSSGDGKFHLKAITNENNGTYGGDLAINDITVTANHWYDVQIRRNTDARLDVWIDGVYIGGFDASQRYPQQPLFMIQTLANEAKTLGVRQVRIQNYTY